MINISARFDTTHRADFSIKEDFTFKAVYGRDTEESKRALIVGRRLQPRSASGNPDRGPSIDSLKLVGIGLPKAPYWISLRRRTAMC